MSNTLDERLAGVWIDDAVWSAYPEYVAVVIAVTGLNPGPSTQSSEALLVSAEQQALELLDGREPHELPELATWREAFTSFGVKPRDGRSSVEALMRRISSGLPRIDRLTDTYNAISVKHLVPVGGEDLSGYVGSARLVIASGDESFDTVANGEPVTQRASPGEVVWRDDVGVTCRRWNWRQCVRTRLSENTKDALFIIDSLGPDAQRRGEAAAGELMTSLATDSASIEYVWRTVSSQM